MEKISFPAKTPRLQNQYSYLNHQLTSKGNLNSFSLDLCRLKTKKADLPAIKSDSRNMINKIKEKIILLKQKLKSSQSSKDQIQVKNMMSFQNPFPTPLNYQIPNYFQYPYPYPYSYLPNQLNPLYQCQFHQSCPHSACHHCANQKENKPKKQKDRKKGKKKIKQSKEEPKDKKRKNFRVYAYAVYFCIYFKCFSEKFTENRRKWFFDRYQKKEKNIIYQASEKILKKLQQIDFYKLSKDVREGKFYDSKYKTQVNWEEQTKTALVPLSQLRSTKRQVNPSNKSTFLGKFSESVLQKAFEVLLDDQVISQYHEVFSAGSLDMNFLIDNLYLPEQIPFLFVHPTKGYLRLNYQEQIHLLLVKVMVRMIIYNYLLGLDKSKVWNKKLQTTNKLAQFQIQEVWELARTVAVYLYSISKDMYLLGVKNLNHNSNFREQSRKFGVKIAKSLEEVGQNLQGGGKFELIKNFKRQKEIEEKLGKSSFLNKHRDIIKEKIVDFLIILQQKLKKQERQVYKYLTNLTLSTPYLIFESKKSSKMKQISNQRRYRLLQPGQKKGRKWDQLYSNDNTKSQKNSYESQETSKSKKSNVRFKDDLTYGGGKKQKKKQVQLENSSIGRPSIKIDRLSHNSAEKQGKVFASSAKRPFNIDVVNYKFDENRQDRLRQKFRNILLEKPSVYQNKQK